MRHRHLNLASYLPKSLAHPSLVCLGMVILICFMSSNIQAAEVIGHIKKVSGNVLIGRGLGTMKPATADAPLYTGSRIKTKADGKVKLLFSDKTILIISENSSIRLSRSFLKKQGQVSSQVSSKSANQQANQKNNQTGTKIELLDGLLRATIDPKRKNTLIAAIETKSAAASIRGTELLAVAMDESSLFFLNEGSLVVSGQEGEILMKPDQMTANTQTRRPLKPISLKDQEVLRRIRFEALAATSMDKVPPAMRNKKEFKEILIRFYLNYASYLVDTKEYYDAITVLIMSADMTSNVETKAESWSFAATIHGKFLNEFKQAGTYYNKIINQSEKSRFYENALYNLGLMRQAVSDNEGMKEHFERYLEEFPEGRHCHSIQWLLDQSEVVPDR